MQKRIYHAITLIVMTAVIIFGMAALFISHHVYKNNAEKQLRGISSILMSEDYDVDTIAEKISGAVEYNIRITYISMNGTVLFDSNVNIDAQTMENHFNRPEIQQAINEGSGDNSRVSKTLGKNNYYYAKQYKGNILRFAIEIESIYTLFIGFIPLLIIVGGLVILISTLVSVKISENIIKPINSVVEQMDIFNDAGAYVDIRNDYEELNPIIKTINRLMKRIEGYIQKMKEEKNTIAVITENMVEGMIILDRNYKILSVNKSAMAMLNPNFKVNEKSGDKRSLIEFTRNRGLLDIIEGMAGVNANGVFEIDDRNIKAFVNQVTLDEKYGLIILLVDVTESTKAEEIRRDFSANVSHELKTPLTTIKGFGEMLENGIITDSEEVKHYGCVIFRESTRLLSLINDIIRLSEIEEKTSEIISNVNIYNVAKNVTEILEPKAEKNNITLHLKGKDIIINANESYLSELILNLVDNGIKYNTAGGNVWLTLSDDSKNIFIRVKDDGIGISEEHKNRIFERFYRVDKSRSKQTGGTGLGLSIVKHIVSYHNGTLRLESEPEKGTEIIISIPK